MQSMYKNIALLALLILCSSCHHTEYRFSPSQNRAFLPDTHNITFEQYIATNRHNIKTALTPRFTKNSQVFGVGYTLDDLVDMRSPFQIKPQNNKCNKKDKIGFLLLHGLTDTPYSFTDIAPYLSKQYRCATIRATLMTGHGTIPGDSLEVDYTEWVKMVTYGLSSFADEVTGIYLIGFSTGSTLALHHIVKNQPLAHKIHALIMLAPALKAKSKLAFLAPFMNMMFPYMATYNDTNAAAYESFSYNLAAQFYLLTQQLILNKNIETPVFMALAADDETIDTATANTYFCNNIKNSKKRMLWYHGKNNNLTKCTGITEVHHVPNKLPDKNRFINHSHTSIPWHASNTHYGIDGKYSHCLHYFNDTQQYSGCKTDNHATLYGSRNLSTQDIPENQLLRRSTFNPNFDKMMQSIVLFIEDTKPR